MGECVLPLNYDGKWYFKLLCVLDGIRTHKVGGLLQSQPIFSVAGPLFFPILLSNTVRN